MTLSLEESFEWARRLTRRTAGNFYYAFLTLPAGRFRDTCALYAFMRITDDIGDAEGVPAADRARQLARWRDAFLTALDGGDGAHPVLPAVADLVARHEIPRRYPLDVIAGVESDLEPRQPETFDELARYCYHVAGAVGVCCIHVWGTTSERAVDAAIDCGVAFQLTNILRDLAEDADVGRVYLPREDLDRFDYRTADVVGRVVDDRFRNLMRFEVERARDYYRRAERLFDDVEPATRPILSAMIRIYRGLLDEIERRDFDVYRERVRLSRMRKLWIAFDSTLRGRWLGRAATARRNTTARTT